MDEFSELDYLYYENLLYSLDIKMKSTTFPTFPKFLTAKYPRLKPKYVEKNYV